MHTRGPVPFEEFMRRALHDSERGYYARRITGVGSRGDFTTAPMLSEAPAKAVARWAALALRESGCRRLIEIGPGEGKLAEAVWRNLPWHLRWKSKLHLVETSVPLMEIQKQRLGKKAAWHRTPQSALEACDGHAVIFSNELVDAFPVKRFRNTENGWLEMAVDFAADGRVTESLRSPAPLPDSSGFSVNHPAGQLIEVHDSYRAWLQEWLPAWKRGRMLTIDYGATVNRLYHRRPRGSVRAYFMQQRLEGPEIYQNIGRQDLTADVNFTDLIDWSAPWIEENRLQGFGEFLGEYAGITDSRMTDPDGPGGAFLVLDQKRR